MQNINKIFISFGFSLGLHYLCNTNSNHLTTTINLYIMKYKQLLLPIATLLISLLQTIKSEAQNGDIAARINPILSYSTARDGHIAFDTFLPH